VANNVSVLYTVYGNVPVYRLYSLSCTEVHTVLWNIFSEKDSTSTSLMSTVRTFDSSRQQSSPTPRSVSYISSNE